MAEMNAQGDLLGEPVLEAHIAVYYSRKCSFGCNEGWIGRGQVGVDPRTRQEPGEKMACGCAIRRFLAERPDVIRHQGKLYYPPGGMKLKHAEPEVTLPGRVVKTVKAVEDNEEKGLEQIGALQAVIDESRLDIQRFEEEWQLEHAEDYAQLEDLDHSKEALESKIEEAKLQEKQLTTKMEINRLFITRLESEHEGFKKQVWAHIAKLENSIKEHAIITAQEEVSLRETNKGCEASIEALREQQRPTEELIAQNRLAHVATTQMLNRANVKLQKRISRKRNAIYNAEQRIVRTAIRYNLESSSAPLPEHFQSAADFIVNGGIGDEEVPTSVDESTSTT
jgi:hypothetical protein